MIDFLQFILFGLKRATTNLEINQFTIILNLINTFRRYKPQAYLYQYLNKYSQLLIMIDELQ